MGRPALYDADALLDHAVALVAAGGPQAVSVSAVASAAGAPSGSVYHRFPARADLLAALWQRTVERFQAGFLAALEADDPQAAGVAAALHTIRWCREHPGEAHVLLAGAGAFRLADWSGPDRERLARVNARVEQGLRALARRLGSDDAAGLERACVAVVDLPLATVKRHAAADRPIPAHADEAVRAAARALLAPAASQSPTRDARSG